MKRLKGVVAVVPTLPDFSAGIYVQRGLLADEDVFSSCRHATFPSPISLDVVKQLSRFRIQTDGHGPAVWDEQFTGLCHEVALRGERAVGHPVVVDANVRDVIEPGVRPDLFTGFWIDRVNEGAHRWPDARTEVKRAGGNHRSSADGPERYQTIVTKMMEIRAPAGSCPKGPTDASTTGVQAVNAAVV